MKLSMRSDYGARAIVDLALHYGEGPVQSGEIAARQLVPEAYLEQLLTSLRKAGLIRSTRGPRGGHELARHPSEITFEEVITTLEGPLVLVDCLEDGGGCQLGPACSIRDVWSEVSQATRRILESTTIEQLADRQRAREGRAMYHI
jgi:Rrf2 family protein